ncbi:HAD family hydrolase [Streptomyces sp. NBC_01276]|uniref:HAD family hydrolase n=1 Tax=Streptomyces sp. NBC_01276 TaxID=2903808 RepID=UPI00352EC585
MRPTGPAADGPDPTARRPGGGPARGRPGARVTAPGTAPGRTPLDAVIFDLDGTLVDSVRPDFLACGALFAEYGQRLPREFWAREVCGRPEGYPALFALLRGASGAAAPDDAALRRRLGQLWEVHMTPELVRLLPGVPGALERARAAGLRLAVASSSDGDWVRRWLRHYGLGRHFDAVVTGDDVTRRKPDPEAYLTAAAALGAEPGRCLAVEDSLIGVAAARAAGMTVVAVPTALTRGLDHGAADRILPDLSALHFTGPATFPRDKTF